MWLSRKMNKSATQPFAEKGEVTLASRNNWEADASKNVRNISCYLPYGFTSIAPVGEEVLILEASDGSVALGVKAPVGTLNAGEIKISSSGGACIELKNDGSVIINKTLKIDRQGRIENGAQGD
ncbi:MAG: hypothetical protein K6C14_00075 [Eubacterium sp.]|nr:hypothetical protein [Eubacterium sp.]